MNKPTIENALENFSAPQREILIALFKRKCFDGVISKDIIARLLTTVEGQDELLLKMVEIARCYAQPMISGFYVGAALLGESGDVYLGANLEIVGQQLNNSIHAEQSTINSALLHGEKGATRIAISAAPCGHCRQFLNEMGSADTFQVIVKGHPSASLNDLLPHSFGPQDVGVKSALFEEDPVATKANMRLLGQLNKVIKDATTIESYAPHTGSYSCLLLQSQDVSALGIYIENAAYNPSLSPLTSALDRLRFQGAELNKIDRATLFELAGAQISHAESIESILSRVAPQTNFSSVSC